MPARVEEREPKRINEGALSLSRRVEVNGRQTTVLYRPEASRAAALCLRAKQEKKGGRDSAGRRNILSAARLDARGMISQPAYRPPRLPLFCKFRKCSSVQRAILLLLLEGKSRRGEKSFSSPPSLGLWINWKRDSKTLYTKRKGVIRIYRRMEEIRFSSGARKNSDDFVIPKNLGPCLF